jgi:hypothetical protein
MTGVLKNGIYSQSPPPSSGAVRLDDFLNPPPPPPSDECRAFELAVARVMRIRSLSRSQAERAAFEIALVERLNTTHPDTPPDRCAHCGRLEVPGAALLPIGAGARHAWLHSDCWETWRARRRAEAEKELRLQGVVKP